MPDRTDLAAPRPKDRPSVSPWRQWTERLMAPELALSEASCKLYGARLSRFDRALAELGTDLAGCSVEQMKAAVAAIGWGNGGLEQLRAALVHGLKCVGRELPRETLTEIARVAPRKNRPPRPRAQRPNDDAPCPPLTVEQAQALERTAWAVGGVELLAVMLALHTDLPASSIEQLRWDQVHLDTTPATLDTDHGATPIHSRLARALREHNSNARSRASAEYVFPGREPGTHGTRSTLWRHVRFVSGLAGLGSVPLRRLRWTSPGEVNPDRVEPIVRTKYQRQEEPLDIGIGVEDLMATGLSEKSAGMYLKALRRIARLLEDVGTDLMTCTGRDLAAIGRLYPNTHAMRSQLRGALNHGWEALGREEVPSLKALRVPPRPRGRSRALDTDIARRLEQAAWERDDVLGLAVLVGLYAALRRFEIAKLRWEDFVYDEAGRATWVRVQGKGSLVADVPIHPALAEALARFRRDKGYLFPGRYPGRPVRPGTIWTWVRHVAAEAGLSEVPTHVLRHTALTEANDASGDLRTVQEIARHSRPEMTAIYTRVTSQRMITVVNQIDYGRNGDHAPDPADSLPTLGYRRLVALIEGEASVERWVDLGLVLAPRGWQLESTDAPGLHWTHPLNASLMATAGAGEFSLIRQAPDGEDLAELWELPTIEQLVGLADALVTGAPAPEPILLGPWVEAPFVEYLRSGEWPQQPVRPPLALVGAQEA